ncbi:hypothetical protein QWJ07_24475 [Frankia sp. RB7]|nr:hypothetical protein [Frankia sp. RB7]
MLNALFGLVREAAHIGGSVLLIVGCLFVAAGIFSGRIGNFIKGGGLIVAGGYLLSVTFIHN